MKDDEMASAGVFLFSNGQMHYQLSGSRRKYQSLAPVNLLLYEASLWACHAGLLASGEFNHSESL